MSPLPFQRLLPALALACGVCAAQAAAGGGHDRDDD
jgi:hypothetical protein